VSFFWWGKLPPALIEVMFLHTCREGYYDVSFLGFFLSHSLITKIIKKLEQPRLILI
jgi:hypothetical protein